MERLVRAKKRKEFHWTDFRKMDTIVERGFEAMEQALPRIRDIVQGKKKIVPIKDRPWHHAGYGQRKRFALAGF